ncbi:kinetochore protein NDC80 homolog [Actinia tenebrosa]|uniref:Kinetochore protein NDC80 n=1 Tax=Actinia tenebrosa TaxID=6105 RepID=A0A6P8IKZ2_ACTTE|nr:kinetochore protein NDC80 homolog [Actinia tenebrosa]
MRRATLGALNNGNQPRQAREKKMSFGAASARPSIGGRPSTGRPSMSSKRSSSQYGRRESYAHNQVMKDPRNLSDKGVYRKNIKYLMEFLTESNYPNPISERILSAPPMKEFKRIFMFIYKYINPNVKDNSAIDKKPEEEIPRIFKMIGYPFTISKSSMFSVGSPHTWPNLLGALCWLIELTRFSLNIAEDIEGKVMFPDDTCGTGAEGQDGFGYVDRLYFEYLEEAYAAFMRGKELDELQDYENKFLETIRMKNATAYQEIEQLEEETAELEKELAVLEGPSKLESLVQQQKSLEADKEMFKKYISDLKRHSKKMEESNAQLDEEIHAIRMELEAVTKENAQLQNVLNNQEMSPADVLRIKKEKQELMKQLQQLEKHRDQLDQQIWDQEMQYAKIHEETEKNIREYNETARKLKLIPTTAENAHGFDFELHFDPQQTYSSIQSYFKDKLKPALIELQAQLSDRTRQLQTQIMTEDEALDQVSDMINERQEELDALEARQAAFDKEFERKKEVMANDYQQLAQEVDEREKKLLEMKQISQETLEKKNTELRNLEEKAKKRISDLNTEVEKYKDFLLKACHLVMEHKTKMNNCVAEIEEKARAALEETRNLEIPKITIELPEKEEK